MTTTYATWGVGWNLGRTRFHVSRIVYVDGKFSAAEFYTDSRGRAVYFRSLEAAEGRRDELNNAVRASGRGLATGGG